MKEIIKKQTSSVINFSEVNFTSCNPIGIQSPEGCKLLVRITIENQLVLTKLVELNSDKLSSFGVSGKWAWEYIDDLLEDALNHNYKSFLFDSWQEFYEWCAE